MVRRLLVLNGAAIIAVILYHSAGWGFTAMFPWAHRYLPLTGEDFSQVGSLGYYALRLVEQLVVFSIPAFMFVSGYFMAFATGRNQDTVRPKVVGARIRDLLIPYLLWSLLLLIAYAAQGRVLSPSQYLTRLLVGGTNPAYYYVPLLVQMYLLSPLLVRLARKHWKWLLLGAGLLQLAVQLLYYPIFLGLDVPVLRPYVDIVPKWFFAARIFWFSLGIVVGFQLKSLEPWLSRLKWPLLATAVALIPVGFVEWEWYQGLSGQPWLEHRESLLDWVYSAAVIFAFLAFSKTAIPFSRHIEELGVKSFGIYLIHSPVMEYVSRIIYHVAPWLLAHQILLQPILIVAGLGVPLLLMALVNRSPARTYYKYSFG